MCCWSYFFVGRSIHLSWPVCFSANFYRTIAVLVQISISLALTTIELSIHFTKQVFCTFLIFSSTFCKTTVNFIKGSVSIVLLCVGLLMQSSNVVYGTINMLVERTMLLVLLALRPSARWVKAPYWQSYYYSFIVIAIITDENKLPRGTWNYYLLVVLQGKQVSKFIFANIKNAKNTYMKELSFKIQSDFD